MYDWATAGTGGAQGEGQYTFANPGSRYNTNDNMPVAEISWRDQIVWCNALTEYYNSIAAADDSLDCVYFTDEAMTIPLRSCNNSTTVTRGTKGSQDDPYIHETSKGFRLPTSDEWELAARYIEDKNNDGDIMDAGEYYPGTYASGAEADFTNTIETNKVACYNTTAPFSAKSKKPNALTIYNMSGNVTEHLHDWDGLPQRIGGDWGDLVRSILVGRGGLNITPYQVGSQLGMRIARTR